MKRSNEKQLKLALKGLKNGKAAREHGGEGYETKGTRKTARPFDPSKHLFVTMRSADAVGEKSMLHPKRIKIIKNIVFKAARTQGIIVNKYVCVGNHIHLLLKTKSGRMMTARPALRAFMREVSGLIARVMTGARKGQPMRRKFWDNIAWSRIVDWGRSLRNTYNYFKKNYGDAFLKEHNWFSVGEFVTEPP